ncbi:putative aldehyde dehydrogenase-like protein, partial [Fusarium oxysporum f. sp. albedinis]
GARALQHPWQRTGRQAGKGSVIAPRARRRSTDAGLPTKNRKTEAERSVPGVVVHLRS